MRAAPAFLLVAPTQAKDKLLAGLIPGAQQPTQLDGNLDEWEGAFLTSWALERRGEAQKGRKRE
jgi:hypothetical protein